MNRWQWLLLVLPEMAAGTGAYFLMKYRMNTRWKIMAKCMVTWMAVCTAAVGLLQQQKHPFEDMIFWAMVLFLAADGLLEICFPAGAAVFGLGHVLLILWYFRHGGLHPMTAAVFAVLCLAALVLFRKECRKLWTERNYLYLAGMLLYLAFLMLMVSMAVLLPTVMGTKGLLPGIGALAFAGSDMMVGKNVLVGLPRRKNDFALCLYYAAVLMIAFVTWTEG